MGRAASSAFVGDLEGVKSAWTIDESHDGRDNSGQARLDE